MHRVATEEAPIELGGRLPVLMIPRLVLPHYRGRRAV